MANLNDFPLEKVIVFIRSLIERARIRDGLITFELIACLTIEEARLVWAASKWMEIIETAPPAMQPKRFNPSQCLALLMEKTMEMKSQAETEKWVRFVPTEIRMLIDAEAYLDSFALARQADAKSNIRHFKGRKK